MSQLPTAAGRKAKPSRLWHEHAREELAWDAELPPDAIFHFLLPDPGMAAYADKVIKELEPEAIERCKRWNKAFVGEPFTEAQIAHLLRLSRLVDSLWQEWAQQQRQLRQRTTDPLPVWDDPTGAQEGAWTPLKLKDRIQEQEVLGRDVANTNARLRLKWAMDYWVALWFWPIRQAGSLPGRDTWLLELSMILGDLEQGVAPEPGQLNLFADTQPRQLAVDFSDRHGFVDVQKLKREFKRKGPAGQGPRTGAQNGISSSEGSQGDSQTGAASTCRSQRICSASSASRRSGGRETDPTKAMRRTPADGGVGSRGSDDQHGGGCRRAQRSDASRSP